ncbi:hypothetical protein [Budvicia aquatica]|nr:hypothetical protein [Budvicia aquatica]PHI28810.1 hypothetical protein CRN84_05520 [Budvicia aquatica]
MLLSGLFFCPLVVVADTANTQAVKLFTNPWSRLFSGDEAEFSTALTYSSPLKKKSVHVPTGKNTSEEVYKLNQRGLFSMQYSPISYFFTNMTVRVPLQNTSKYSTDFVYSFGYDDWHPGTFSLVYGNYNDNNRFFPETGAQKTRFEQGSWTFGYKFTLPKTVESALLINNDDALVCQVGYSYVPRYYSDASSTIKDNKNSLLGSCGYTLQQHYFLRLSAFYYPDKNQQQPWNYDYTYSFGYTSGYAGGSWSIYYGNYTGTRYPWRQNANANFSSGTINLSWNLPL